MSNNSDRGIFYPIILIFSRNFESYVAYSFLQKCKYDSFNKDPHCKPFFVYMYDLNLDKDNAYITRIHVICISLSDFKLLRKRKAR